jgi:hypothetical protein
MAAIQVGTLNFDNVYQHDMFDITFSITGESGGPAEIDLTGKVLKMQVREEVDGAVKLEFNEDDGTLTLTENSDGTYDVRLYQDAEVIDMEAGVYYHTIVMYTDDSNIEDVQTIIAGTMTVVNQYTEL